MTIERKLSEAVHVERRFQRSIRLDADWGQPSALDGYLLHQSAKEAIETTLSLVKGGQGAFTWTGPYGGGKSSLALTLASCFHHDQVCSAPARSILAKVSEIDILPSDPSDWLTVLVSGKRSDPVKHIRVRLSEEIANSPGKARTKKSSVEDISGTDIVDRLKRECEARPNGGVVLIIDELGKYLEAASDGSVDIHFFQDLAEAANRSGGKLIVIGVLHQAFENYALHRGPKIQDEWAKIQGRYIDVPLVTVTDEVIDLVGKAIVKRSEPKPEKSISKAISKQILRRRPAASKELSEKLEDCWPLHPATAVLLGPISRRRFGQNERSVFSFLSSSEPGGFSEFLEKYSVNSNRLFEPADLWDYLQLNLEPLIQASSDGHRWALAIDALGRIHASGSEADERLLKTISVIDLFGNGSGLVADEKVLRHCVSDVSAKAFDQSLSKLKSSSTIIYRKHLDAYALFQGSDFDLEKEIELNLSKQDEFDTSLFNRLGVLKPILAKRYHFETGTPRWFETSVANFTETKTKSGALKLAKDSAGKFLLLLPQEELPVSEIQDFVSTLGSSEDGRQVIVGIPTNSQKIIELGKELFAVTSVQNESPELEGDIIARREVEARLELVRTKLEEALLLGFSLAVWVTQDGNTHSGSKLAQIASEIAYSIYPNAPIVQSELTNRQKPSSNTNAAIRGVLHAIAHNLGSEHLGFDGYPAERGLIATVFEGTGLYAKVGGTFEFLDPRKSKDKATRTFSGIWDRGDDLLSKDKQVSFGDLYEEWERPPYGMRRGLMPLVAMAFLLSRRNQTAIYVDGIFQPEINDLVMDLILQDQSQVAMRGVGNNHIHSDTLAYLSKKVSKLVGWKPEAEPLPVAQALVEFVFKLPNWSRKAHASIPDHVRNVRRVLLDADDPHQLFDIDLPQALNSEKSEFGKKLWSAIKELRDAYPNMIDQLRRTLLSNLKVDENDIEQLRGRAQAIKGQAGDDLKLGGFINRLSEFNGSDEEVADLCGLVTSAPVNTWHDLEPSRAAMQLSEYAYRFRRVELFGSSDNAPTQTALMVMSGIGPSEKSVVRRGQVSLKDIENLRPTINEIGDKIKDADLSQDQILALIAELTSDLIECDGGTDVAEPLLNETS